MRVFGSIQKLVDPMFFNIFEINMITTQNILKFQNTVIVLDDMGDKYNSQIKYYYSEGRQKIFK